MADMFREEWCERCVHWGRDALSESSGSEGCPVMDVHFFFQGDALKAKQDRDDDLASKILAMLISDEPSPGRVTRSRQSCAVFVEREGAPLAGQPALPGIRN